MLPTENITIVRRYLDEAWNKGNVGIIDELMIPNYARYLAAGSGGTLNREGNKQRIAGIRAAFPDIRLTVEDIFAQGDKVTVRVSLDGTHQGQFRGIAPTGKQISITAIDIIRLVDGKIAEHWGVVDQFTLMQQLGAIPLPG